MYHRLINFLRSRFRLLKHLSNPFLTFAHPGHFYSPLPDRNWRAGRIQDTSRLDWKSCGVHAHEHEQLAFLEVLAKNQPRVTIPESANVAWRYRLDNEYFATGDGPVLYALLNHLKPCRIIEIGSGYSSALMLDYREHVGEGACQLTFIEPYPSRLRQLLKPEDMNEATIIDKPVQLVEPDVFNQLDAGDILFIDSSHVVKYSSDVVYLFFDILPRLKPGVIIHVHDILAGFEYPDEWMDEGRAWNEAYLLRAFLQYNASFRILLWPSFISQEFPEAYRNAFPQTQGRCGGSIYLERL